MTWAAERRPAGTVWAPRGAETTEAGRGPELIGRHRYVGAQISGRTGQDGVCAAEHVDARAGRALSGDEEGRLRR
jgi:hypothetical protein